MTRRRTFRKRFRVLILAAIVAAVVVPVGFALSLETTPVPLAGPRPPAVVALTTVAAPTAIAVQAPASPLAFVVSDALKLAFVGAAFLGLAAAVKRAV